MKFDHVAIEVNDFDDRVQALVNDIGMTLVRRGIRYRTGQRIAMLGDETGVKIELIESDADQPAFAHVAFRADEAAPLWMRPKPHWLKLAGRRSTRSTTWPQPEPGRRWWRIAAGFTSR